MNPLEEPDPSRTRRGEKPREGSARPSRARFPRQLGRRVDGPAREQPESRLFPRETRSTVTSTPPEALPMVPTTSRVGRCGSRARPLRGVADLPDTSRKPGRRARRTAAWPTRPPSSPSASYPGTPLPVRNPPRGPRREIPSRCPEACHARAHRRALASAAEPGRLAAWRGPGPLRPRVTSQRPVHIR